MSSDKYVYNAERERRRLKALVNLLENHDAEQQRLENLQRETPTDASEHQLLLEGSREKTALILLEFLYSPEFSLRDAMRSSVRDIQQIADDVLLVNDEAEKLCQTFESQAPEAVRVEWDSKAFSTLVYNLARVRQAVLVGGAMVGPVLAERIAEHEIDKIFGPRHPMPKPVKQPSLTVVTPEPRRRRDSDE